MYGYYLATFEWDALTNLFASDGTIEIALRGVYVGKASVRRNLNLYGQQGPRCRNTAQPYAVSACHRHRPGRTDGPMRSRAFSMMGVFGKSGQWMGGVYENLFVKVDGGGRIKQDHVVNTYFTPYDVGWKDLAARPAPGITARQSSRPTALDAIRDVPRGPFLPPYHYDNPVTGSRKSTVGSHRLRSRNENPTRSGQVARRALDLLEFIGAETEPPTFQTLCDQLKIPRSSLSHLMTTLIERGYGRACGGAGRLPTRGRRRGARP